MKNNYTAFLRIIFIFIITILASFTSYAKNNKVYKSTNISIESLSCSEKVDEVAIIKREFPSTTFTLNFDKNILETVNNGDVDYLPFTLNENDIKFKEETSEKLIYGKLIFSNDKYLLKIKNHDDDCFSFVITFDK